jgi:signal peptide peptidase-like protein 2B
MSDWFVWILIVLFCIGGVEGMHICSVALLSRSFGRFADMTIKVPIVGEVSLLSVIVLPFCIALLLLGLQINMLPMPGFVKMF